MVIKGEPVDVHFGIDDLLKRCDYICNVLPKSPDTDNILGGGKLQLCQGNIFRWSLHEETNRFEIIHIIYHCILYSRKW